MGDKGDHNDHRHTKIKSKMIQNKTLATAVPDPIAMPMFAFFKAGASLTPSPVIATLKGKEQHHCHVSENMQEESLKSGDQKLQRLKERRARWKKNHSWEEKQDKLEFPGDPCQVSYKNKVN